MSLEAAQDQPGCQEQLKAGGAAIVTPGPGHVTSLVPECRAADPEGQEGGALAEGQKSGATLAGPEDRPLGTDNYS